MTEFAVDVDGVLANMVEGALVVLNRRWGTDYTKYDLTDWDFWHLLPELAALPESKQRDTIFRAMEEAWESGYVQPAPGAARMMRALRTRGRVTIVTKTLANHETLLAWLAQHGIVYDDIIHIPKGAKLSKASFGQFDVFIDDSPQLAQEMPLNKSMILVNQPWNENVRVRENVRRIYSLAEAEPSAYMARRVPSGAGVRVKRHVRRVC